MVDSSDQELVQLCLGGENRAFDVLVERYKMQMHRTACGIVKNEDLAKDITQNGFVKAWQRLSTYDPGYKFYSWLYRIIVNEALNQLRSQKDHDGLSDMHSAGETPYQRIMKKEEKSTLAESIDSLPLIYKTVIQLRHFEELSYKEIAEVLDIDTNTVKSRLYTARMQLRQMIYNR